MGNEHIAITLTETQAHTLQAVLDRRQVETHRRHRESEDPAEQDALEEWQARISELLAIVDEAICEWHIQ